MSGAANPADAHDFSVSLYMGDGTGVLFDRFLHLQGRKKDPPRRKSNIRKREGH